MCLIIKKSDNTVTDRVLLKDFATREDLNAWFELYKQLFLGEGNHCDDYSRESRRLAELDGYSLSLCLMAEGKVYYTQIFFKEDGVTPDKEVSHMGNIALVEKNPEGLSEIWYVDLNWSKLVHLTNLIPGGIY